MSGDKAAFFTVQGVEYTETFFKLFTVVGEVWGIDSVVEEYFIPTLLIPQLCPINRGKLYGDTGNSFSHPPHPVLVGFQDCTHHLCKHLIGCEVIPAPDICPSFLQNHCMVSRL